jgi:hypothetical protein
MHSRKPQKTYVKKKDGDELVFVFIIYSKQSQVTRLGPTAMLKIIKPYSPLQKKTLKKNEPKLKFPLGYHENWTLVLETFKSFFLKIYF